VDRLVAEFWDRRRGTLALLALLAALVGTKDAIAVGGARGVVGGSMMGLTISLCWLGPGTMWPIVLLVSSVLTAGTVVVGIGVRRAWAWLTDGRLRVSQWKKFRALADTARSVSVPSRR
jgi:hypothetical protein